METQDTIREWTDKTFGTVSTTPRVAVRAQEELVELLRALTSENYDKAPEECADVVIVLCRVADRLGERLDFCMTSPGAVSHERALRHAAHASSMLASLIDGMARGVRSPVFGARDVARSVAACCAWLGADMLAEIDAKMQINRARVWKLDGSGHGYHVRAGEAVGADLRVALSPDSTESEAAAAVVRLARAGFGEPKISPEAVEITFRGKKIDPATFADGGMIVVAPAADSLADPPDVVENNTPHNAVEREGNDR